MDGTINNERTRKLNKRLCKKTKIQINPLEAEKAKTENKKNVLINRKLQKKC